MSAARPRSRHHFVVGVSRSPIQRSRSIHIWRISVSVGRADRARQLDRHHRHAAVHAAVVAERAGIDAHAVEEQPAEPLRRRAGAVVVEHAVRRVDARRSRRASSASIVSWMKRLSGSDSASDRDSGAHPAWSSWSSTRSASWSQLGVGKLRFRSMPRALVRVGRFCSMPSGLSAGMKRQSISAPVSSACAIQWNTSDVDESSSPWMAPITSTRGRRGGLRALQRRGRMARLGGDDIALVQRIAVDRAVRPTRTRPLHSPRSDSAASVTSSAQPA